MPFMEATARPAECQKWTLREGDVLFTMDSEIVEEIGVPAYVVSDMPDVLCGYHLGLARPSRIFIARSVPRYGAGMSSSGTQDALELQMALRALDTL